MMFFYYLLSLFSNLAKYLFRPSRLIPLSVNYHFTRKCNYQCGFCFHTAKNSFVQPLDEAKKGLRALQQDGMRKVNFAGGEPFLYAKFLGELVKYCKQDLRLESVSIVSNGSKIKERWFEEYGEYVDIIAISCDSFDEKTNVAIGRGSGRHLEAVKSVADLCRRFGVKFKLNTVVNRYNFNEDMAEGIHQLRPFRWKVFQVLVLEGENSGSNTLRDARTFTITSEEFQQFVKRHEHLPCLVPEDNSKMQNSYLILDENLCFLNCTKDGKEPSESILKVGVQKALRQSGFDSEMFQKRGGEYDWTRSESKSGGGGGGKCCSDPSLDW